MKLKSYKRQLEIEKSKDEFHARLKFLAWKDSSESESLFRVNALIQFSPEKSDRQILNHAKINCR